MIVPLERLVDFQHLRRAKIGDFVSLLVRQMPFLWLRPTFRQFLVGISLKIVDVAAGAVGHYADERRILMQVRAEQFTYALGEHREIVGRDRAGSDAADVVQAVIRQQAERSLVGEGAHGQHGDILIAVGGGEGVMFLANLYHDAGKPVIPLNFGLGPATTGASRLFDFGMSGSNAQRLFQTDGAATPQSWLNRIEMYEGKTASDGVRDVLGLLEDLVPPKAFVVRLLNPAHPDYNDVVDG